MKERTRRNADPNPHSGQANFAWPVFLVSVSWNPLQTRGVQANPFIVADGLRAVHTGAERSFPIPDNHRSQLAL